MSFIKGEAGAGELANTSPPKEWDYEADVVIIGAGISGLVAAIRARDLGDSVFCVEANYCCGGHALASGGHVHLGGGHSLQRRMGVVDSADQYYLDHTHPLAATSRYNTREVVRGSADSHAAGFEFLLENGWLHLDDSTLRGGKNSYLKGGDSADTVPRTITTDQTTKGWNKPLVSNTPGIGLTRPLEVSARKKGVKFLMNHHMDNIIRESPNSGRVLGVRAGYTPRILPGTSTPVIDVYTEGNIDSTSTVDVKAKKSIIIATGGSARDICLCTFFLRR